MTAHGLRVDAETGERGGQRVEEEKGGKALPTIAWSFDGATARAFKKLPTDNLSY